MDHKELGTNSPVSTSISDGGTKFGLSNPTVQSSRTKSYDVGSNSLGKVEATASRPCAIIGPDRVLPPNPDDTLYLKKAPGEGWPPENIYRRPPEYPSKISDCQPTRNISPRQTFQENMQRIMVPPMFSSMKSDETNLKNTKHNMPQEAKYCDVPYNVNTVNGEHKSVRSSDIPMSNVNPYPRNMPPPYGWPAGVNVRPLRPYGAPEFYQYQEFQSCAGPRPMTMIRPHRALHEESGPVYSERLYQDANIRFKPYPTGKEKHQQPRYDYINNYPSTFHPPSSIPPHKYDIQKPLHGHPYPVYPPVPFKYLDRRIHEPFVDGYHRSHNQQANYNAFHSQIVPPPYGPVPGNCMQNKSYSDTLSKPINANKMQFENNNNKVYLNLEPRNKNYPVPENLYYNEMNHPQAMRGEILLPSHSSVPIHPVSQHPMYRKDNTPVKSYDYNPNYRVFDHVNHSLQRIPLHFSPNTISPSDSNTSNDTAHTIGTSHEDCGYVSQSSTTSIRSIDSGNIPVPHEMYRRPSYNNYDIFQNTFHSNGPIQTSKSKSSSSNKKNLDVRQFLSMWNEGDEEGSEGNKEVAPPNQAKKLSQNEIINNQEQLYVLGLVNVPNEELGKYDHIQKISKLPENIKGYNSLEILNQYEELLETPHINNYNKSRNYNNSHSKSLIENKEFITKLPRPVSPLDVEAKISQSVIHKEVGCNFEIKPCSPKMLNVEIAAPVQNILGERMIEKVINPIVTKTPNLTRSNSNKSQNIVNDVKVASCKMMSDPYSIKSSQNRLKTSNYGVQEMENTGLCLSSLPQLDNDIELNFPEINQQFIKANQMESSITPVVQNLQQTDLQKTHCLSHEIKDNSRQSNLSPHLNLCSVGDKESSKLSKYRKCKKSEVSTSHNLPQQDSVKSVEPIAALQRIDSVIIKNPETIKFQSNDSGKISTETTHDIQTDSKQCSMKYEKHINTSNLSSDTAIDFSLNRSEDETAVSYLTAINKDTCQNLPPLEGFDEENNVPITDSIPVPTEKLTVVAHNEVINELHSEHLHFKINEEYNDKSQEIDKNKFGFIKLPENPYKANEKQEYNVLVMKKLDQPEISAIKNQAGKDSSTNKESPVVDITSTNNLDQISNQDNLFLNSTDVLASKHKMDIENVDPVSTEGSQKGVDIEDITIESVMDDEEQYNYEKSSTGKEHKIDSNVDSDILFDVKAENAYDDLETIDKKYVRNAHKITGETVDDSFSQDFGNLNNLINNAIDDSEKFVASPDPQKKENVSDSRINLASQFQTIAKNSQSGLIKEEDCLGVSQSVTSETNTNDKGFMNNKKITKVNPCEGSKNQMNNTTLDITDSTVEKIESIETETNPSDLSVRILECTQQSSKTETDFECSDNSTVTFSRTLEIAHNNCESKLDQCGFECLTKENDEKICDLENETSNRDNKIESMVNSTSELVRCGETVETLSSEKLPEENDKSDIMCTDESASLFGKAEDDTDTVEALRSFVNKPPPEIPNDIIRERKKETELEKNIETECETSTIKSDSLSLKFDLEDNSAKESCLLTKNVSCFENTADQIVAIKHETKINISDSVLMSDKTYINSIELVEDCYLTSNNKMISEKSTVNIEEYNPEIDFKDSIQADFVSNVNLLETKNFKLSDPNIKIEESVFTLSNKTSLENSTDNTAECSQIGDGKDNDLKRLVELNKTDIGPCSNIDLEHNNSTALEGETMHEPLPNPVVQKYRMHCKKELFSPWIQKLTMFTEGVCMSANNNNFSQEDKDVSSMDTNCIPNNFPSCNNEENYELCDINNETTLLTENDVPVMNCTSPTDQGGSPVIQLENSSINSEVETKSEDSGITPAENNKSYVIKPRKISKRSLSESALEAFQCNNDVNFVHPCKRKKLLKGDQSFLESQMITEDICNIIQTNRRNSISTFYNEDNVYIVIDNDLILSEENDDSDKICYTESAEEYLTSLESTNEINLNVETDSYTGSNQINEYPNSTPLSQEKCLEDPWVDDVACIETVFSEDVAENIVIDIQASPKKTNSLDFVSDDEESTIFCDSDHLDKIKSIYGRNMCDDNTQLIETLYRTPQMDVNKTLYHIDTHDPKDCLDDIIESCFQSTEIVKTDSESILKSGISSNIVVDDKENMSEIMPDVNCEQYDQNIYSNFNHTNDCDFENLSAEDEGDVVTKESSLDICPKLKHGSTEEEADISTIHSCESSNDCITMNVQKENSSYSSSSSPEVSSTTSEENNSSILLKITNCNGSRVSQINEITNDSRNKLSYKLTEKGEYRSYNSNFNSSRKLITKAAQKYIPPLKEIYDLKVKLPLPQHRLHTLKQLKVAKVEQKVDVPSNDCTVKRLNYDISKKPKPKFEDVLKSIDEINYKRLKDNTKKGKTAIPKVIIKKNENGAHYASSKTPHRKETYNPDLTGRKWQPWVFLEKNNFVDKMALQNKVKAVFCHRKNSYVLSEKFRKYKSIYNANFIITQPKSDTKGNLKYTIRLKSIH